MKKFVVSVTMIGLFALPTIVGAQTGTPPKCFGRKATIVGTNNADVLNGTGGVDVIVARGGKDEIHAKGAGDFICGGGNADEIYAGGGSDTVRGEGGSDVLIAGTEENLLAPGADQLGGDGGGDTIIGGPEDDFMRGGSGVDALLGITGGDTYNGGDDLDIAAFLAATNAVEVDLGLGYASGEGDDTLIGMEAVIGSAHNDRLDGTDDPDFFWGHTGNDEIHGWGGRDYILFGLSESAVTVDLLYNYTSGGEGSDDVYTIENVMGSNHNDTIYGDAGPNYLSGEGGTDTIYGEGGADACFGETISGCPPEVEAPGQSGTLPDGDEPPAPAEDAAKQLDSAATELSESRSKGSRDGGRSQVAGGTGYGYLRCFTGQNGANIFFPTNDFGHGMFAWRTRPQNTYNWTNYSTSYWLWYDSSDLTRQVYNGGWYWYNYNNSFIAASPGNVVQAWWRQSNGNWYVVGECLVESATATGGIVGLGTYMVYDP